MTNNFIPLIAICISLLAVSLAIYLYFITKIFSLKEYREKKREAMFNWVHGNLIEDVYIPLTEYAGAISDELSQETPRKEIVLYRISKFLHYVFKNREIFGGDMYFTPNEDSNRAIENISDKIISELNMIYYLPYPKNPTERRIVILEFLATCAKCRNYSEFELLTSGRPIFNKNLTDEIDKLMDGYSKDHCLPRRYGNHNEMLSDPLIELLNPRKLEQAWRRAKLYAYCSLFNKLFMYEIHKIYDSWYVEYPDTLKYHQLVDVISLVDRVVAKMDGLLERDCKLREESYSESCVDENDTKLNILKEELSSATGPTAKEIEKEIEWLESKREMLKGVELLYTISPHRYKIFEKNRSGEFYKTVRNMKVLESVWVIYRIRMKDIKAGWWTFRMIVSLKLRNNRP